MPRAPEGLRRPLVLAVVAHVALIIGLAFSVNWRSSDPPAMEAELWAAVPQTAARRSDPPPPADPPPPRPTPRAVEPPPKELPDAQIAIEKARKERLKDERERKAELEKKELEKKLLDKKEQDKLKRDQADKQAEKLLNDKKDLERKKKEEREKADAAAVANREAQLQRIMKQAGADNGSSGSAERSAGPSANYGAKVKAAIGRPNSALVRDLELDPTVTVEVRTAADGRIVSRRIIKSSGNLEWDEAVLKKIDDTKTLPLDGDKPPPASMNLVFNPRER